MAGTDAPDLFSQIASFAAAVVFTLVVVKPMAQSFLKVWKENMHRFRPFTFAPERPLVSNLKYPPDKVRFLRRLGAVMCHIGALQPVHQSLSELFSKSMCRKPLATFTALPPSSACVCV